MTEQTWAVRDTLSAELQRYGELLYSPAGNQVLLVVREPTRLLELAGYLDRGRFYLVTMIGNDERELEERCFKVYHVFSHPSSDLFVQVEYLLEPGTETYPSLFEWFPAVDPFERELVDMLGLRPAGERRAQVVAGSWLHESYPDGLYPLRREFTAVELRLRVSGPAGDLPARAPADPPAEAPVGVPADPPAGASAGPLPGGVVLPVGPIHAGVIEPGEFAFTIVGEVVEDLQIRLGYTHRGIERLFQSHLHLLDGWWLAEQVSGDSSFAHSLAYCRAAETLTDVRVPPAAELLRGALLELERIHNHVAAVAGLAEDVALERIWSELAVVREQLLRLNWRLTGHRYLRRLNRPGGLVLPAPLAVADLRTTLDAWLGRFNELVDSMKGRAGFRDRVIGDGGVGVLTKQEALRLGATGLVARACGIGRDSRRDHPSGGYAGWWLAAGRRRGDDAGDAHRREARAGDVHARFLTRVDEVREARLLVHDLLDRWEELPPEEREYLLSPPRVLPENNYTYALGFAEGFRGDVVYWLMQDKMSGIFRCKIRDPSMLNWPALRQSVLPRTVEGARWLETVLADFPIINQSFHLSYAGNDL